MNKYSVNIEQDDETGELLLPLPEQLLAKLGWEAGDTLKWDVQKDGSILLSKVETELVLVDCISQFKTRYLVEVPKGKKEWALDTVTMEEAKEFSQDHLGETIVSSRVLSKAEALSICIEDNPYMFLLGSRDPNEVLASLTTREGI